MSFEGRFQQLCEKGHETITDIYDAVETGKCPFCSSPFVWSKVIDDTNGVGEIKKLKVLRAERNEICDKCGVGHFIEPTVYEIPEFKPSVVIGAKLHV